MRYKTKLGFLKALANKLKSINKKKFPVRKPKFEEEYKNVLFEIVAREGAEWKDMRIYRCSENKVWSNPINDERYNVRFFVKVVGLRDTIASSRNWGKQSI